jgi:hypothetical protein
VKRLAIIFFGIFALSACAPQIAVENNILPTLLSVTAPETRAGSILIQGRYFGDGMEGQASDSYVLLGADALGEGGIAVKPSSWKGNRITVGIPEGAGSGYIFVFVRGNRSNGLPTTLP